MNWTARVFVLAAWLAAGALGCESVALMPRRDVDRRDTVDRSPSNRDRDSTREVVGTVERIDEAVREIHLRTSEEGRSVILKYDSRTIVSHRDRDLRVEDLRRGDLVLVDVARDARGDQYAELIRMNDRPSSS
jgi:hypothetical protein